jgi:16S rRNA (cytosine967-C5)-methyltransferase
MKGLPPSARTVAARVVERVARDAAFAAAALDTAIAESPQLTAEDHALATELAYGVLRTEGALRARLERLVPRGLPDDHVVVSHLLVGAYQILLLDRVPAYAAVDGAVSAIKAARGAKVAGFVNAVLRRLGATGERLSREAAIIESAPAWLLSKLESTLGKEEASAVLGATPGLTPASGANSIRVRSGAALPGWIAEAPRGRASPLARVVARGGDLRRREGYDEGAFVIQDEGAQVVGLALGAKPNDRVLDACAGRGQKTSLLRERVGDAAELWAVDLYPEKIAALETEFRRLGIAAPRTAAVDWTVGSGSVPAGFDRVLVDAPCSGTGTLRRRPEIARRLAPEDPARLAALAEAILRRAASHAKAGGKVVFAVCSVLSDEGEAVVRRVADVLRPVPFDAPEVGHLVDANATSFRLTPAKHGTDGFFVASFERI